ncbi:YihY/virulence factor BrkB family protein [Billgrantia saliphila]|uniref:YihY/virulence factor BrkB family protein n=1 Tax=Billgrantia saliphila TaxID=1848458 RepID=UPI000CE56CC9|nr:YihY/virulence factor BrkB family protein [Halomonas saliphila]
MREISLRFWWNTLKDAVGLWLDRNAFSYAGSLAFYTLFSLAPTVIIAVAVIGVVFGEDAAHGQIVTQLQGTVGEEAAKAVEQAVAESRVERSGVIPTLLGVGGLLVGATTVFAQMQFSLNMIWGVTAKPSRSGVMIFLKQRLLSLAVVIAIGFILLVSLVVGVMLRAMLQAIGDAMPLIGTLTAGAEFFISLLVITALFAAVFKILPDVVLNWRDVLLGAVVTSLLFAVGRSAIASYLAYTATASTYGAAGSVVMILLWVYYSSLILLFGAAFTRCYLVARGGVVVPRNSAVIVRRELVSE